MTSFDEGKMALVSPIHLPCVLEKADEIGESDECQ